MVSGVSGNNQPVIGENDHVEVFQRRLGLEIRRLREEANWTQQEVVERLGQYDTSWLSAAENGRKNLSAKHLARFEAIFGVRIDVLSSSEAALLDEVRRAGPDAAGRALRAARYSKSLPPPAPGESAVLLPRSAANIESAADSAAHTIRTAAEAAADALRDAADALAE